MIRNEDIYMDYRIYTSMVEAENSSLKDELKFYKSLVISLLIFIIALFTFLGVLIWG